MAVVAGTVTASPLRLASLRQVVEPHRSSIRKPCLPKSLPLGSRSSRPDQNLVNDGIQSHAARSLGWQGCRFVNGHTCRVTDDPLEGHHGATSRGACARQPSRCWQRSTRVSARDFSAPRRGAGSDVRGYLDHCMRHDNRTHWHRLSGRQQCCSRGEKRQSIQRRRPGGCEQEQAQTFPEFFEVANHSCFRADVAGSQR
jgi:hypothetical protein